SSPDRTVYVLSVSPPMLLQASPFAPQISHWYWKLNGLEPFQVPGLAVSLLPTTGLPVIVGAVSFVGATAPCDVAPIATPTTTREARPARATGARRPENRAWLRSIFLTKSLLCDEAGSCAGARRLDDRDPETPPRASRSRDRAGG